MQNIISVCGQKTRDGNGPFCINENRWSPGAGLHSREWTLISRYSINIQGSHNLCTSSVKAKMCHLHFGFNKSAVQQLGAAFQWESQQRRKPSQRHSFTAVVVSQDTLFPWHNRSRLQSQVTFSGAWGACTWFRRDASTCCFRKVQLSNSTSLPRLVSTIARPTCWRFQINVSPFFTLRRCESASPDTVLNSAAVSLTSNLLFKGWHCARTTVPLYDKSFFEGLKCLIWFE